MPTHYEILENLCSITVGYPASRAKKMRSIEHGTETALLVPSAMSDGMFVDSKLEHEHTVHVKDVFFTLEHDIVLKLTTPFDCVLVDRQHEGILVTSFAVIMRPLASASIDMRYLAAYLNMPQTKTVLQSMGTGTALTLLKKKTLASLPVPLVPIEEQRRLAKLFENNQARKNDYYRAIELGDQLLASEFARLAFSENTPSHQTERKS